ncbi:arabinan endo-1,5-alpha-L-arabinosidase [uncultured Devosia sp.]|uniref:arabinan endo-1,5-alpha-L-arabinosidase n=1 Tax=uncultured Devosia sp. TaxID=211434 RepID=UPI0035CA6552
MARLLSALVLCLLALPALAEDRPTQPVLRGDLDIHDPTLAIVEGAYMAFGTGEEGGIYRGAIRAKTSPDGISWTDAGAVGKGLPKWVRPALGFQPLNIWAPSISARDGRHFLYYAVSVFGIQVSAIGLMTNDALDPAAPGQGWQDQGMIVQSRQGDDFNAIDPYRIDTADGRAWLVFGSYWDGIRLIEIDPAGGKALDPAAPPLALASRNGAGIEAPAILEHDGKFYLFVSFDQCCAGLDSTYHIMVGRADAITGPYRDRAGNDMMAGAAQSVLAATGRYIGPGGQESFVAGDVPSLVYHFYDGDDRGRSKLQTAPILWTDDGWPYLPELP